MSDTAIYKRQNLGQKLTPGRKAALLVVDFVNGFNDPEVLGGGNIQDAIDATVPVLRAARMAGMFVVFTRIVYAEGGEDTGVWCEKVPALAGLTEAHPSSQIVPALAPKTGELVIAKRQASAFFATGLDTVLRQRGIDTLFVTGCTTSGCVRATLTDAISLNFRPFAIADCLGDRALGPHEANLFDIGQKYADLLAGAEAIELFESLA